MFIALRDDEPWFAATELYANLGVDPIQAAGLLDEEDKSRMEVGPGKSLPLVSEYGFHALARGKDSTPPGSPVHSFHRWVVKSLLPAVRKAAKSATHDSSESAVYVFANFAEKKLSGSRQGKSGMSCAKLLAYLWRHHSNGQWSNVRKPGKLLLSQQLEVNPRSLGRAMECLVGWGVVDRWPDKSQNKSREWPDEIRLNLAALKEAMAELGLDLPKP